VVAARAIAAMAIGFAPPVPGIRFAALRRPRPIFALLQCPPKELLRRKADIPMGSKGLLGRVATLRSGTPLLEANAGAAVPKTSGALISTTTAPEFWQVSERTSQCRTCVDYVADDCHTLAPKPLAKWRRNPISGREKVTLSRPHKALGICELNV
jgi:hypothetical protein